MGKLDNHDHGNKVSWVSLITMIMHTVFMGKLENHNHAEFHTDGSPSIQEKYIIKI